MMDYSPEQKAQIAQHFRQRMASCQPWSPNTKWAPELNIVAASYPRYELFPDVELSTESPDRLVATQYIDSADGRFRYLTRLHPAGRRLETWWGAKSGDVLFDAPIPIPMLFEREDVGFGPHPWMSITPAELITLRPGTNLAKGKVVIAGLGLGWQLLSVARRQSVREITLVEQSSELCDLILPRLMPEIRRPVTVIVGDAYRVLPRLTADVALVDVFPTYGNNGPATDELARRCPGIHTMWGWGAHDT